MSINDEKNKIVGFSHEDLSLIINGNHNNIKNISNPNHIGQVMDKNNKHISDITPLIMVINANGSGEILEKKVYALIHAGADPNMEVNYYNRTTTAKELALNYRDLEIA